MRYTIAESSNVTELDGKPLNLVTNTEIVSETEFYKQFDKSIEKLNSKDETKMAELKEKAIGYLKSYSPVTVGDKVFEIRKR